MSTEIESLPILFASLYGKARIPAWAKRWNVSSATFDEIQATEIRPGIVVIQSRAPAELVEQSDYLPAWSKATSAVNPYVVVEFAEAYDWSPQELAEVLRLFPGIRQVDFANGTAQLKKSLTQSMAKYLVYGGTKDAIFQDRPDRIKPSVDSRHIASKTATDALGEAQEVIAAIRPLLARSSGRLSAPKVAELFGLSTAKLGGLIGSSRQALGKTPDASAIQVGLRPFERIARLLAIFSKTDFRAWLNRTNQHLDGHTPMQVIESGRAEVVADLVESMLTGTPS